MSDGAQPARLVLWPRTAGRNARVIAVCTSVFEYLHRDLKWHFIGFHWKKSNSHSKLTGREMCENNSGNIHIIEAPAVSHPDHWTYCCSATFNTFCKSCRTNKAAAAETLRSRTEGWKRGDGKVGGLFIRQDFEGEFSARCWLTREWLHGALMVTGTNGPENKNAGN